MMESSLTQKLTQIIQRRLVNVSGSEFLVLIGVSVFTLIIAMSIPIIIFRRRRAPLPRKTAATTPMPRFRKRDRIRFLTRKMLRRVQELKDEVLPPGNEEAPRFPGRGTRRRSSQPPTQGLVRFLRGKHNEMRRQAKEVPASLLEADWTEMAGSEPHLPVEVMYMLRSVRIFGHFEKPLFFELCKHIETKTLPMGTLLFRPGQMDDCIYIVQSGQLNLYLVDKSSTEMLLKKVHAGENIHSVMNILDAMRGANTYKYSISIRAAVDSKILKLPSRAFKKVFEDNPESLTRVVQIVMLRLQQVTFQALHRFLGLSIELISASSTRRLNEELKGLSVYSLGSSVSREADVVHDLSSGKLAAVSNSPLHLRNSTISPIKEVIEDLSSPPGSPQKNSSSSTMRRTVSFTNSVQVVVDDSRQALTLPADKLRRSSSLGKLLSPSGAGEASIPCVRVASSDFETALGRARLTSSDSPRKFLIGSPEDEGCMDEMPSLKWEAHCPPSLTSESDGQSFLCVIPSDEEERMLSAARADLVKLLTLPTPKLLDNILAIAKFPPGAVIVQQGDKEVNLYFLVQGSLEAKQKHDFSDHEEIMFTCVPGEFIGSLALLTGEPSMFSVVTTDVTYVVVISKVNFYNLVGHHPKIVLPVANSLIQKMSSFVRNIDFALDWMMVESGKPLYRQDEDPDSIYIVLNGRLRAVRTNENGKKEISGEFGKGEFVGLVEVLTHTNRTMSVHAIRDTELAMIPEGLLNTIKLHYPQVVTRLIHLLGDKILGTVKRGARAKMADSHLEMVGTNLGTVAVIPASNSVPLHNFTFELSLAINEIGPCLYLTSDIIKKTLGTSVLDSVHEYFLSNWLGQQEDMNRIVVYQADSYMSEWTKRCIRQADAILIVGMGEADPAVGLLESQLESMSSVRAQKDLILLYEEENFQLPSRTIEWLNARGWISTHHHVRCPKKIFSRRRLVDRFADDPDYQRPTRYSDFARLARILTGTSVGVVLGGGGARGIAHVGIVKAMTEAGIPIDMIGGTSFGAFIGALYAQHCNVVNTVQRAREASRKMASMWKKLLDLTYPHTSLFTGRAFNEEIRSTFGEAQIEDLLLPFFCVTTDITSSKMKIHQAGSVWRYVRASMSLSGYLPPLCDPRDGNLLLDGGYVNNLPADIMRSLGARTIIAVDVGSLDEVDLTNYGDCLSGWWLLWKKWNPFASPVKILDMAGVQARLAYVSCVQQLEEVKSSSFYHYIRPPIDKFKTLQFGSFEEIMEAGYQYGKGFFQSLLKGNVLPGAARDVTDSTCKHKEFVVGGPTAPSFADLAELVSRIQGPKKTIPKWLAGRSGSNLLVMGNDECDGENDSGGEDYFAGETQSDQEMIHESDLQSGPEEVGYESEGAAHRRRRRHILLRMNSSNT